MAEQEWIKGEGEDVEAHRRGKKLPLASEEPADEAQGEDVEAHRRGKKLPLASEEAADEAEGDDVEAHALRHRPQSL